VERRHGIADAAGSTDGITTIPGSSLGSFVYDLSSQFPRTAQ
jgi:hypothetical protein